MLEKHELSLLHAVCSDIHAKCHMAFTDPADIILVSKWNIVLKPTATFEQKCSVKAYKQ